MGSVEGSAIAQRRSAALPGYERLEGPVPVRYRAGMEPEAVRTRDLLESGAGSFAQILAVEPPDLEALLVADDDWEGAPRENERPYPAGLPYFTRAASPPTLVLPETLSGAFRPRTEATYPLVLWHELAHAFLLREPVVRTPAWLRELLPQALAAAAARRRGVALAEHLAQIDHSPGFTVRSYPGRADAAEQMAFQNLLLSLGDAALERFGEAFLSRLVHALRQRADVVGEEEAEELIVASLGSGAREWLSSRPEF